MTTRSIGTTWTPTRAGWPRLTSGGTDRRPHQGPGPAQAVRGISLDRWLGLMDEDSRCLARIRRAPAEDQRQGGARRPVPAAGRAGQRQRPGQLRNGHQPDRRAAGWRRPAYDLRRPGHPDLERQALKLAVQRPALCGPAFDALARGLFSAPVHCLAFSELIARLRRVAGGRRRPGVGRAAARRRADDRARAFITRLAVEPIEAPSADGEPDARYADAVLARVEELARSRQIAVIKSRLQRLSPVDGDRPGTTGCSAILWRWSSAARCSPTGPPAR